MGLNGTGMLVINPPWQFDAKAEEILQYLQPICSILKAHKWAWNSAPKYNGWLANNFTLGGLTGHKTQILQFLPSSMHLATDDLL